MKKDIKFYFKGRNDAQLFTDVVDMKVFVNTMILTIEWNTPTLKTMKKVVVRDWVAYEITEKELKDE